MIRKLTLLIILLLMIVPLACADSAGDPSLTLFQYDPGYTLLDPSPGTFLMFTDVLGPGTLSVSGTSPYEYQIENWTGQGIYNLEVVVTFPNPVLLYSCGIIEPAFWSCETTPSSGYTSTITWFFQNTDGFLFNLPDLGNSFYLELDGLAVSDYNGATATIEANIPEPASLYLMGTGLLAAVGVWRRKRVLR